MESIPIFKFLDLFTPNFLILDETPIDLRKERSESIRKPSAAEGHHLYHIQILKAC
jgi:hypothetical protein